jgi:hypothetical protein
MDAISQTKFRRQIAPWAAGASDPQYSFNKQSIVNTFSTAIAWCALQQWRNPFPLTVSQNRSHPSFRPNFRM